MEGSLGGSKIWANVSSLGGRPDTRAGVIAI